MSEVQTGIHEFKSGGFAYDAEESSDTPAALAAWAIALPDRLNPDHADHSTRVDEYWQAVIDHADSLGYTPSA